MTRNRIAVDPDRVQVQCLEEQGAIKRFTAEQVRNATPELTRSGFVTCDAHDAVVAVLRSRISQLLEAAK